MARYIDADIFVECLKQMYCKNCNNYNGVMCRACTIDDVIDFIEDAPTADVVKIDDCFEIVIMSAVRYALGRQTYVPHSVIGFITPMLGKLSSKTLAVLERDISEAGSYGDETIDKPDWMNFLDNIRKEREKRECQGI